MKWVASNLDRHTLVDKLPLESVSMQQVYNEADKALPVIKKYISEEEFPHILEVLGISR